MSRKIVRLTVDHLARLTGHASDCLFWQLDPVSRGRVDPGREAAELEAWTSAVLREWGSCGRIALVDDQPVGLALYGPPRFFAGAASMPTAPVSPDAILLASVYVDPVHRHSGLGRMLVQGVAADLVARGCTAVEAFGSHRPHPCVAPMEFWSSLGCKTHRPHVTTPRMRMELRTALTWRDEVEQALERWVGKVRPEPKKATRVRPS